MKKPPFVGGLFLELLASDPFTIKDETKFAFCLQASLDVDTPEGW
jgi:hypothetical protein